MTGSSFYPGGTPPVIYFQWGNLFGIVKYVVLAEEKSLKANILVYFEDMLDRNMDQCIIDYNHHLKNNIQLQHEMLSEKKFIYPVKEIHKPDESALTFSNYFLIDHLPHLTHK